MNWDSWVMECLNLLSQQTLIESLLCHRQKRDPSPCLDGAGYPGGRIEGPVHCQVGVGFLRVMKAAWGFLL